MSNTVTAPDKFDRIMELAEALSHDELLDLLQEALSYHDDVRISNFLAYITTNYS